MSKIFTPKNLIALLFLFVVIFIHFFSHNFLDNRVNDSFVKLYSSFFNKSSSNNVVLVVIDDKSLKRIAWPWKRNLFSDIFDFLEFEAGAKSIVFQEVALYPDTYNPQSDKYFYENLRKHNILINSFFLSSSNLVGDVIPPEYLKYLNEKTNVKIVDKRSKKSDVSYKSVTRLPKDYLLNSKYFASSFLQEDKDEVVRNYIPFANLNGDFLPSLALSAYSMYSGINSFVLYDDKLCSADDCKTLSMPIIEKTSKDYIGNMTDVFLTYIDWYKATGNYYSHKVYSAIDILDATQDLKSGRIPKIDPKEFQNKIVIIGLNADDTIWDFLSESPVLKKQADIDVHAVVIDNMLQNKFMKVQEKSISHIITIISCLLVIFGFRNFKRSIILALSISFVYFIYYILQFSTHIYIEPVSPMLTAFSCAIFKRLYFIITTDKTTEMIKRAMGKYISKDVMKTVLSNPDMLKVGGIRTVVSVLFVDIRNFTTLSEQLTPADVTSILNEYFSVIEPIIGKYNGVINKYLGDGALVIFGEPIKDENHATNAIMCANDILFAVQELKNKMLNEGKPKIDIGIGINTGEVFAGNIGTDERLEYTIIGDSVNLAYRIESYNRILKTQFLISEYTYNLVKDIVDVVKLSQFNIKGKSLPLDIYEVLKVKNNNE